MKLTCRRVLLGRGRSLVGRYFATPHKRRDGYATRGLNLSVRGTRHDNARYAKRSHTSQNDICATRGP